MQLKCDINETKILKFVLLRNHHHLQKRKDACQRKRKKNISPKNKLFGINKAQTNDRTSSGGIINYCPELLTRVVFLTS